jgi:hypothetical protein
MARAGAVGNRDVPHACIGKAECDRARGAARADEEHLQAREVDAARPDCLDEADAVQHGADQSPVCLPPDAVHGADDAPHR